MITEKIGMANTNLVGMKYMDMPEEYRRENTKQEFKQASRAQKRGMLRDAIAEPSAPRMAGDRVFDLVKGEEFRKDDREKLLGRIENMERRQEAGKEIDEELLKEREAKLDRFDRRASSQSKFDGTLASYDYGNIGKTRKAGVRDLEFLSSRGFTPEEIAKDIADKGAKTSRKGQLLLDKYTNAIIGDDPQIESPATPIESPTTPIEPPATPIETPVDTPRPGSGLNPDIGPVVGGENPFENAFTDNIVSNPAIYGDTGDVTLDNGSMNYGTINTGIINDIRDYGGGYGQGENNTGLAQSYIDQMEENWNDYSGPRYGAMITDSRVKMADKNNPINTAGLYASIGRLGQDMYDKGLIGKAQMYGDPYTMPSATYPEFPDLGFIEEEEESYT